ncbi:MAG: hypothetical protein HJJLKODD_02424 [Phycisphaerae bacterium]|nr:hypothetical protein [Phycisphaerae bacterium]
MQCYPYITGYHLWLGICPKGMPRGLWTYYLEQNQVIRRITLAMMILYLCQMFGFFQRTFNIPKLTIPLVVIIIALISIPFNNRKRAFRRFCQLLLDNHYRFCLHCGYDLSSLPDEHHCPECGEKYEIHALKKSWIDCYQVLVDRNILKEHDVASMTDQPTTPADSATPSIDGEVKPEN